MNLLIPAVLFTLITVDFLNDFFNIFSHGGKCNETDDYDKSTRDWTHPSNNDTNGPDPVSLCSPGRGFRCERDGELRLRQS